MLFALGLSIVTGIVVGLIPAFAAANSKAQDTLRDGTRATASPARRRTRAALIVAEVALAMTLTVCGGLLLRSFVSVLNVDPGFKTGELLTMQIAVPPRYIDTPSRLTFYDDLETRLRAVPGVTVVGGTTRLPLGSTTRRVTSMWKDAPFRAPRCRRSKCAARYSITSRRWGFRSFVEGRSTATTTSMHRDRRLSTPRSPRVLFLAKSQSVNACDSRQLPTQQPWMTIVGVVGNIKHGSLEEVPKPEIYITYRQATPVAPFVVLRTTGNAADISGAVRQAVREAGADPPTDMRTMDAIRSGSVASRRFVLLLVGLFGVLALGLAALGVFGVITLIGAERTTEVGIRLALGATPSQVLGLIVGHALKLAVAGIAIGLVIALLLRPVLKAQLFGIGPTDPVTYIAVALALMLTALGGALIPARRAMRVDPACALRN